MARLAVDIDSIATVRNILGGETPDPAQMVVLAEMGGAESIVCYLRDDMKSVNERDVYVLRELIKTHFNVRCNLNDEMIKKLLPLKPDMITFVAPGSVSSLEAEYLYIDNYLLQIENAVAELRANEIGCSVLIEPNISQIKQAGKLELDYVELNANAFSTASDLDQELAELENLNSLCIAANRLGMGVNISGGISADNIAETSRIQFVDDIIVGEPITIKALSIGYEQAVRDFISLL